MASQPNHVEAGASSAYDGVLVVALVIERRVIHTHLIWPASAWRVTARVTDEIALCRQLAPTPTQVSIREPKNGLIQALAFPLTVTLALIRPCALLLEWLYRRVTAHLLRYVLISGAP